MSAVRLPVFKYCGRGYAPARPNSAAHVFEPFCPVSWLLAASAVSTDSRSLWVAGCEPVAAAGRSRGSVRGRAAPLLSHTRVPRPCSDRRPVPFPLVRVAQISACSRARRGVINQPPLRCPALDSTPAGPRVLRCHAARFWPTVPREITARERTGASRHRPARLRSGCRQICSVVASRSARAQPRTARRFGHTHCCPPGGRQVPYCGSR